jgi:hypothetical protein
MRLRLRRKFRYQSEVLACITRPVKTILLALVIAISHNEKAAAALVPSDSSCAFYSEIEELHQCGNESYLSDASYLCEKYLAAEPKLSAELQAFQKPIRLCLQKKLLEKSGANNFCSDLESTAVASHLECYHENNYCDLSREAKKQLRRLIGKKALEAPWFETGIRLLKSCYSARTR